ncbi:hypothetical protein TrRE_jg9353 [Triparma retinervis]|uniref:Uncharacterized protein n=1 Tax=Triparma retinervis TaxID=2557542 RepID=A0A9W7ECX4_9STRA|nr:hypothetical protein TrRE_jg9353 [Triparma retinervis]
MSSFAPTAGGDRESLNTKYSTKAILTDRGQYMSYLECQLERVTASLLAHGSLEKRMVDMDETMSMVDDRISSMTKVAKLSQTFAERWGEDTATSVSRLTERVAAVEGMVGGNQNSNDETKSLIHNVTDHISSLERLRLEATKTMDDRLVTMEGKVTGISTENVEARGKFASIDRRFEEMEAAFEVKLGEAAKETDRKLELVKSELESKVQQVQRSVEVKLSEQAAELARLRHEASLMENRMLAALAKQANVTQEQIQTIHEVVQQTPAVSHHHSHHQSAAGAARKLRQFGNWDDDDDDDDGVPVGRYSNNDAVAANLVDEIEDLYKSLREQKKTLKEHGLILEKHDTAGVAVEEAVERVAEKMHGLETSIGAIGNNYSTMSATLSNKILSWQMNVVADLEKKLGEDIHSLSSAQDSLDSRLNVFRETVDVKMGEVKSEMEKQLSSSESSAEKELKMSKLVQHEVSTLEERLVKKQEDLLLSSQQRLTDQLHHQYKKQKKHLKQQQLEQTPYYNSGAAFPQSAGVVPSTKQISSRGGMTARDLRAADETSDDTPPLPVDENYRLDNNAPPLPPQQEEEEDVKLNRMRRKVERERRKEAALELDADESDESVEDLYREVVTRRGKDGKKIVPKAVGKKGGGATSSRGRKSKKSWIPAKSVPTRAGERSLSPTKDVPKQVTYEKAMRPYTSAQRLAGLASTTEPTTEVTGTTRMSALSSAASERASQIS